MSLAEGTQKNSYKNFEKSQGRRLSRISKEQALNANNETAHFGIKVTLCELMEGVLLNSNRIEALSEQLFTLNRHVTQVEGRLMRLATDNGVARSQILDAWTGREICEEWPGSRFNNKAWKKLLANSADEIVELRDKIKLVVDDIGLSVSEFREVIQTIQRGQRESAREEGNGRGEPASSDFHCEEIH